MEAQGEKGPNRATIPLRFPLAGGGDAEGLTSQRCSSAERATQHLQNQVHAAISELAPPESEATTEDAGLRDLSSIPWAGHAEPGLLTPSLGPRSQGKTNSTAAAAPSHSAV
ncbi:unnamed protein product [Lepidochelys olivacea]